MGILDHCLVRFYDVAVAVAVAGGTALVLYVLTRIRQDILPPMMLPGTFSWNRCSATLGHRPFSSSQYRHTPRVTCRPPACFASSFMFTRVPLDIAQGLGEIAMKWSTVQIRLVEDGVREDEVELG